MSIEKFTALTSELNRYLVEHSTPVDEALRQVERASERTDSPQMQMSADQGALTSLLVRAIGARRALEVGTFTGYGAISIARGLPEDGELICCELRQEYAELALGHLRAAGLADRVEIRLGPALETLRAMPAEPGFDFAFIDADKRSYPDYYEECLLRLRPGGLMLLDNVLMGGRVLDPDGDPAAEAVVELNRRLVADERVDVAMVGIADGITFALKR